MLSSILVAAFTGRFDVMVKQLVDQASFAVEFTLGLIGVMALFLGLMHVAREGGLLAWIARKLGPVLTRLFPDVPADSPAMSAMIMNLSANVLGLGNAATPFGLKAMVELEKLNPRPGVATDAMALFLAINTTSVTLLPTGVIAVRAALGSQAPAAIWVPTLVATLASTLVAITMCLVLRRRYPQSAAAGAASAPAPAAPPASALPAAAPEPPREPATPAARLLIAGFSALLVAAFAWRAWYAPSAGAFAQEVSSHWLLPVLMAFLLLVGVAGRVKVYETAIVGMREALDVGVRIVPFLVAIFAAIAMFRASGAMDLLVGALEPITSAIGMPAEALPMALLRPLSGSGAFGLMSEIIKTHGPDSFVGNLVSVLQGSTETTFYVLAVYYGAAGIRVARYTLAACLIGDLAGFAAATAMCHLFFD
jgi:spore maturation protein SpmA/spore maturation protein SpmB